MELFHIICKSNKSVLYTMFFSGIHNLEEKQFFCINIIMDFKIYFLQTLSWVKKPTPGLLTMIMAKVVKIEKWSFWEMNEQKWKWRQRRRLQLGHHGTGEPLCYSGQSLSLSSTLSSKWVFETRHPLHHHYHQVKSIF